MLPGPVLAVSQVILLATSVFAADATDWSSRSIYQLITDRFATPNNTALPCDTSARKYCGGSWSGIMNHLDYIQGMGFDAVWISPVSANLEGATSQGEAFHGYWTKDLDSLNPHFGTAEDLRALSAALHKRGMYLMLDVVVNHVAAPALPGPNFTLTNFFHPFTNDLTSTRSVEQCWLGDADLPLPDLNTEDATVVEMLQDWVHKLVQDYGADGLRIDTVKHIRKDFWPDFPRRQALANAFFNTQGKFSSVATVMTQAQQTYKHGLFRTAAFLVRNAMTFPFIHDGIPIVYYGIPWSLTQLTGQEQGYEGGPDPYNREALWFSAYQQEKPLIQHIRLMNAARKQAIEYSPEFLTTPMKFLAIEDHSMVVSKPPMLALFTNAGSESPQTVTWHVDKIFPPGELLVDVLTCAKVQVDAQGGVTVPCAYGMPQVLMPAAVLQQEGTVCPSIATGTRVKSAGLAGARVTWAAIMAILTKSSKFGDGKRVPAPWR
ncbi:glycoside hydrolase family 13 protein [Lactifluus volemus]|nr:glycoside hydrolase family 13 protein [Lactifluus volemus]